MSLDLPPITDAQVRAGARPGESWEEARLRLEIERDGPPSVPDNDFAADDEMGSQFDSRPAPCDDEFDLLEAFARLSPEEQRQQWGRPALPAEIPRNCPTLATLVAAGKEWNACATRMPHEDNHGALRYMVSIPDVEWLTYCRHELGEWVRDSDGSLVGGVAYWRLARNSEKSSRTPTAVDLRKIRALRNR